MNIAMVASQGWAWLMKKPFHAGLCGVAAGCSAYAVTHIASASQWIRDQGGLAGWVQAVGTIVAVLWGFETARRQRIQQAQDLHSAQCREARASISLVHKSLELLADRLNVAAHPGKAVLSLREFRTTEMIEALREIDLSRLPADILVAFAEVRSGTHAINARISEVYKSEDEGKRPKSDRELRLVSAASTFDETYESYRQLLQISVKYAVDLSEFEIPKQLREFLDSAKAGKFRRESRRRTPSTIAI